MPMARGRRSAMTEVGLARGADELGCRRRRRKRRRKRENDNC